MIKYQKKCPYCGKDNFRTILNNFGFHYKTCVSCGRAVGWNQSAIEQDRQKPNREVIRIERNKRSANYQSSIRERNGI